MSFKGYFVKYIFLQGGKKSGLCKNNSKIVHNYYVTKATDLKTIFLKTLDKWVWKHVETKTIFLTFF